MTGAGEPLPSGFKRLKYPVKGFVMLDTGENPVAIGDDFVGIIAETRLVVFFSFRYFRKYLNPPQKPVRRKYECRSQ